MQQLSFHWSTGQIVGKQVVYALYMPYLQIKHGETRIEFVGWKFCCFE